jgi:hypothetical protein
MAARWNAPLAAVAEELQVGGSNDLHDEPLQSSRAGQLRRQLFRL